VTAYVINNGADAGTVTPINTVTNTAGKPIDLKGGHPYFADVIGVTPNGKTVYAAGADAGSVSPISTATNKAGKAIKVGTSPTAIAITP
jgi:hyaluronoglucosaminidase